VLLCFLGGVEMKPETKKLIEQLLEDQCLQRGGKKLQKSFVKSGVGFNPNISLFEFSHGNQQFIFGKYIHRYGFSERVYLYEITTSIPKAGDIGLSIICARDSRDIYSEKMMLEDKDLPFVKTQYENIELKAKQNNVQFLLQSNNKNNVSEHVFTEDFQEKVLSLHKYRTAAKVENGKLSLFANELPLSQEELNALFATCFCLTDNVEKYLLSRS